VGANGIGIACKALFGTLLDKFAADVQSGSKRDQFVTTQTESQAKVKHDDEMQTTFPGILSHFKLQDKDPELAYAELQKYVRMKYCRRVTKSKKECGVVDELEMHEGLFKQMLPLRSSYLFSFPAFTQPQH
jgi:hypothetical protein